MNTSDVGRHVVGQREEVVVIHNFISPQVCFIGLIMRVKIITRIYIIEG
jgi:hypothetical protein